MKKAVALAVIVGTVGVLTTATVVTAWGGARALLGPARTASVEHTGGRGQAGFTEDSTVEKGTGLGQRGQGASQAETGPALGGIQGKGGTDVDRFEAAEGNRGQGRRAGDQAAGQRENPKAGTVEEHDITAISGTVSVTPDSGEDMVIVTEDGTEVKVGTGPGWLATQGFVIEKGDELTVVGFWEDGEFKASEITLGDETIVLRDESGRPMWAGQGRRQNAR